MNQSSTEITCDSCRSFHKNEDKACVHWICSDCKLKPTK